MSNFCLYKLLLKVKKVESIISYSAIRNLFLGILHSEEICVHLIEILLGASSIGMFVKSDTAFNETKTKSLLSVRPLSLLTSWNLLSI